MGIQLQLPLPDQRAAETLRQQIVDHLVAKRPVVGSPLFSESQLMSRAKVSRSTVRRALEPLERSGWIERRQGKGTFVGPRVEMVHGRDQIETSTSTSSRLIRLAVVADRATPWSDDPYSRGIVGGLDAAADECSISVELLGFARSQPEVTVRRLRQSRPDVMAILAPHEHHSRLIGAAMLMKIPCLGTSSSSPRFGISSVTYRDDLGASMGVAELARHGHRRIALIQTEATNLFVHRRQRGYREGILAAGIEPDNNFELTLPQWHAGEIETPTTHVAILDAFLQKQKPTALLIGESKINALLGALYRDGRLRIPDDISFITFDSNYSLYAVWFNGLRPTTVDLTLPQVGKSLATLAHHVLEQPGAAPTEISHACAIAEGETVTRTGN